MTNTMSHVTTTLSSHNPHETQPAPTMTLDDWLQGSTTMIEEWRRPPMNIHGRPAPPSTNGDDGPLAMRTHHHDRQAHMNGHKGPPHHRRMATRGDPSRGRPARYVAEPVCISIPPSSPFHPCSDEWQYPCRCHHPHNPGEQCDSSPPLLLLVFGSPVS